MILTGQLFGFAVNMCSAWIIPRTRRTRSGDRHFLLLASIEHQMTPDLSASHDYVSGQAHRSPAGEAPSPRSSMWDSYATSVHPPAPAPAKERTIATAFTPLLAVLYSLRKTNTSCRLIAVAQNPPKPTKKTSSRSDANASLAGWLIIPNNRGPVLTNCQMIVHLPEIPDGSIC